MIELDPETQARADEANYGRTITEHERESIKRMIGVGQTIMDDVDEMQRDIDRISARRLAAHDPMRRDRPSMMLVIAGVAIGSLAIGIAIGGLIVLAVT